MKQEKSWKERGQALVEFALILPLLMLFVAGIFDFGRYIFTYAQASQQLRTAVREAPVIGFAGDPNPIPPYLRCEDMRDIAGNVFFAENHDVTITYKRDDLSVIGDGDCNTDGEVPKEEVETGYLIQITSEGDVVPVFNQWIGSIHFEFIGQRTIITGIQIGSGDPRDTDYDGMIDEWEEYCMDGDIDNGTGTDDYDNDGINNGLEEAAAGEPPYDASDC
ncbi:MAG: pilus assembly protein [Chloroflexi bacterium]|nr:pilus assembly protein [Chloroflexota bacterium]